MSHQAEETISIREIRSQLVRLAAEIVRGTSMPSEHWEDHPWRRTTPISERRRVLKEAEKANDQCRVWAVRIRQLSDKLGDVANG